MRFATGVLLLLFACLAHAQTYPVKPVRIISPYPPGGLGDTIPVTQAYGGRLTDPGWVYGYDAWTAPLG